jgi:hypothetical protein
MTEYDQYRLDSLISPREKTTTPHLETTGTTKAKHKPIVSDRRCGWCGRRRRRRRQTKE